jgi:GMP synthase-like glutamine amidotransferase
MRLTVGLINNQISTQHGGARNLWRYFDSVGCNYHTIDYRTLQSPRGQLVDEVDCLILTGTDEPTWKEPSPYADEMALIRRYAKPILGICGGHQILALAYGGKLSALPEPIYGRTRVARTAETPLFDGLESVFVAFTKHQYVVAEAPMPFRLTARSELTGSVYAMEHENKFGVQFHPERRNDGTILLNNFLRIAKREKRRREGRDEMHSTIPPAPGLVVDALRRPGS